MSSRHLRLSPAIPGTCTFSRDHRASAMIWQTSTRRLEKATAGVCCRYTLTSQGFLGRLLHVRSMMNYAYAERIPASLDLMRQTLWVEPLVVSFDEGHAEAAAAFKLCRVGWAVLLEEQGNDRLSSRAGIPALMSPCCLLACAAICIGDAFQPKQGFRTADERHVLCRLLFTSPLHRASFLHRHYSGKCITSAEWTVDELITLAVDQLDPETLHKTESLGSSDRQLKRCWQMELYRVILNCLPHDRAVSPDVGRVCALHCGAPLSDCKSCSVLSEPELCYPMQTPGGRGFADLYISPPEPTVLEATRDGKDMTQHLDRFLDPRKYNPLLQSGAVKQHAVIDFCSPASATPRMQDHHLYSVVFQSSFAEAVDNHMGGQRLVRVVGRADDATRLALAAALRY